MSRGDYRQPRQRRNPGKVNAGRDAWITFGGNEFILYDASRDPSDEDEGMVLLMRFTGQYRVAKLPLSSMTTEEQTKLKEFLDYVFSKSLPQAERLDAKARQAEREGDDSFARLYRPVPNFVVRERSESGDDPGVPERPQDVPAVGGGEQPD